MSSSKKELPEKGLRWQVFICLNPEPLAPLTHCTVYVYAVYLFTQVRERGES